MEINPTTSLKATKPKTIRGETINSYSLQADSFAESVLDEKPLKFPFGDIINNMKAVNAALVSAEKRERIIKIKGVGIRYEKHSC